MSGKPYPVQNPYPPSTANVSYNQQPYNPVAYPHQISSAYPPQTQPLGAYPPPAPSQAGPPPPYYPTDPYPQQSAAYPPVQTGYPPQQSSYPAAPVAYPPGVQITGSYDSSARFRPGVTPTIPPPPPGVMANAAQIASMSGQPVQMNQRPADWFSGHSSGGSTFW